MGFSDREISAPSERRSGSQPRFLPTVTHTFARTTPLPPSNLSVVAGADICRPGCHAGDEEAVGDEIRAAGRDGRVFGAEEVMVVTVDEGYVFRPFRVWRDGGDVVDRRYPLG